MKASNRTNNVSWKQTYSHEVDVPTGSVCMCVNDCTRKKIKLSKEKIESLIEECHA